MRHIKIILNVNGLRALQLKGSNCQTGCARTSAHTHTHKHKQDPAICYLQEHTSNIKTQDVSFRVQNAGRLWSMDSLHQNHRGMYWSQGCLKEIMKASPGFWNPLYAHLLRSQGDSEAE